MGACPTLPSGVMAHRTRSRLLPHIPFRTHGASPGESRCGRAGGPGACTCRHLTGGKGRSTSSRAAPSSASSLYGLHGLGAALLCTSRSNRSPVAAPRSPSPLGVTLLVFPQVSPPPQTVGWSCLRKSEIAVRAPSVPKLPGGHSTRPCILAPGAPLRGSGHTRMSWRKGKFFGCSLGAPHVVPVGQQLLSPVMFAVQGACWVLPPPDLQNLWPFYLKDRWSES